VSSAPGPRRTGLSSCACSRSHAALLPQQLCAQAATGLLHRRLACRGFWDQSTDNYAHDTFSNVSRVVLPPRHCKAAWHVWKGLLVLVAPQESLFAVATAFGVYLY
jgi:hypothetical protein